MQQDKQKRMFDQVAISHVDLIRLCKNDREKLGKLRSKYGWSVLQFAIYKEDPECVQILASNMHELVNHVGNSVLPIQSAFNRDTFVCVQNFVCGQKFVCRQSFVCVQKVYTNERCLVSTNERLYTNERDCTW